jgi:hypothetical protein
MYIVRQYLKGSVVVYIQTINHTYELLPSIRITWHRLAALLRLDVRFCNFICEIDIRELIYGNKDDRN